MVNTIANLFIVTLLFLLNAAFGIQLLRLLRFTIPSRLGMLLCACGLSFGLLTFAVFLLGMLGLLTKAWVLSLLALVALLAWKGWLWLLELFAGLKEFMTSLRQSRLGLFLLAFIVAFAILDALMAMAPLTGSDAMHYHFTVPKVWVQEQRIVPVWWTLLSFFTGTGHVLIALGIVLGSDSAALGLIYLGGILTAGSVFMLALQLFSKEVALISVATFLATPMVFWQMSTSGSPDIWSAFYTTMAVWLVLSEGRKIREGTNLTKGLLSGFFAGLAAGGKYTAWATPIMLVVIVLLSSRSLQSTFLVALGALIGGMLPHLRNALWTGDPFFPFLSRWVASEGFNFWTFQSCYADTRAPGFDLSLLSLFRYPILLTLQGERFGVGHYFGPLILTFMPVIFLLWFQGWHYRIAMVFAAGFFGLNAVTSQMARFLLPIFPLTLVLAVGAWAQSRERLAWVWTGGACAVVVFLVFCTASNLVYARDFVPVALGVESRHDFLSRMAPDYPLAHFVNEHLRNEREKAMVFFRHLYHLQVPFIYGDPATSWLMDPARYSSPNSLANLLRQLDVRWVVKTGNYPAPFAQAFKALEHQGILQPVTSGIAEGFVGWRIYGQKGRVPITILKVVRP